MISEKIIEKFIEELEIKLKAECLSYEDKIGLIDTSCSDMVDQILRKFGKNKTPEDLESFRSKISDYRKNLSLSSGITHPIIGICKQVLAFGAAGFALSLGFLDDIENFDLINQKFIAIGGIYYLQLMLVSTYILVLYISQARFRYPFLQFEKIGNTWPFFYYASISEEISYKAFQTKNDSLFANTKYGIDLVKFVKNASSEDALGLIRKELLQHFLLISFQGYINQHSLRLANSFIYGFMGSTIGLAIIVVLTFLRVI